MTRDEAIESLIDACQWIMKNWRLAEGRIDKIVAHDESDGGVSLGTAHFLQIDTALRAMEPEQKPMQIEKAALPGLIDWRAVMQADRNAGGHTEVFDVLFVFAKVIDSNFEGSYQGSLAYAYELANGQVVIVCDSFGSCSGCDAWEGADDDDCRSLVQTMVNNARVFPDRESAREWCGSKMVAEDYLFEPARGLSL